MTERRAALVGTRFRGAQAVETIAELRLGTEVRLEREPDNKYDENAIACHFLGRHVGYISRLANEPIARAMDRGVPVTAVCEKAPVVSMGRISVEPMLLCSWADE